MTQISEKLIIGYNELMIAKKHYKFGLISCSPPRSLTHSLVVPIMDFHYMMTNKAFGSIVKMNNDERDNQSSIDSRQRECRWLLVGRTVAHIIQLIIKLTAW